MVMRRKFPSTRLRNVLKQHDRGIQIGGKRVEYLVYLNYVLFLQRLAKEADNVRKQEKSARLKPRHVIAARKKVIRSCRG